jgi:hypothetical protein
LETEILFHKKGGTGNRQKTQQNQAPRKKKEKEKWHSITITYPPNLAAS